MKKEKILYLLFAVVLVGVIFLSFQGKEKEKDVIKVGVIGPFSGDLVPYGQAFHNGVVLALEEYPNSNIKFIFEDSQFDSLLAISAYRKLIDINKVDVVMDWGSLTGNAITPLTPQDKVPFITFNFDNRSLIGKEYVFSPYNNPISFSSKIWDYLRKNDIAKIGIVKVTLPYFDLLLEGLEDSKEKDEEIITIDRLDFQSKDFRTTIEKIRQSDAEVFGIFLVSGQISLFYRQLEELKVDIKTFGTDFFEDNHEISAAGSKIEGAVYPNMAVSEDFNVIYNNRFGNENQITVAGHAYDMTRILIESLNEIDEPKRVIEKLKEVDNYNGVLGNYSYSDKDGYMHFKHPVHIKKIENGSIVVIDLEK